MSPADQSWRDWPSHRFASHSDFVAAAQALTESMPANDVICLNEGGPDDPTTVYFRTVALKDRMVPPAFDRSRPGFRIFRLDDGAWVWTHVLPDNTPGDYCTPEEMVLIYARLAEASWAADFWRAAKQHGKATLYDELPRA